MKRFEWRLRDVMHDSGIYQITDLQRRLAGVGIELSSSQVHRLVTEVPERLNLNVLAALCDVLNTDPNNLISVTAEPNTAKRTGTDDNIVSLADEIRPRRARVTDND